MSETKVFAKTQQHIIVTYNIKHWIQAINIHVAPPILSYVLY